MVRKIILIDDDADEHDIFKAALAQANLAVECISLTRSNDAIKLLETTVPDYIFVDYNMPAVNGIECIKEIKKNKAMAHVPVVIFSTTINDAIEQKAKAFGAVACIKKTDTVDKLSNLLEKLLVGI